MVRAVLRTLPLEPTLGSRPSESRSRRLLPMLARLGCLAPQCHARQGAAALLLIYCLAPNSSNKKVKKGRWQAVVVVRVLPSPVLWMPSQLFCLDRAGGRDSGLGAIRPTREHFPVELIVSCFIQNNLAGFVGVVVA